MTTVNFLNKTQQPLRIETNKKENLNINPKASEKVSRIMAEISRMDHFQKETLFKKFASDPNFLRRYFG